jgi:hypothetical protein
MAWRSAGKFAFIMHKNCVFSADINKAPVKIIQIGHVPMQLAAQLGYRRFFTHQTQV